MRMGDLCKLQIKGTGLPTAAHQLFWEHTQVGWKVPERGLRARGARPRPWKLCV